MSIKKIRDRLNEWIFKIQKENKYSPLLQASFEEDKIVKISPYNFLLLIDDKLIMKFNDQTYYINIKNNARVSKWIEYGDNIEKRNFLITDSLNEKFGLELKRVRKENAPQIRSIQNENKMQENLKIIDEWIDYLNKNNLKKELDLKVLPDDMILKFSPFNYSHREGRKLFINTNGDFKIYRDIYSIWYYNSSLINSIKEDRNLKLFLNKVKKTGFYSLKSLSSNVANEFQELHSGGGLDDNNDALKDEKDNLQTNNKTFINDVWASNQNLTQEIKILDEYQKTALDVALDNAISVVTGYAGTGKSLTVKNISHELESQGWKVSRVAPTGRASQIIKGKTIHSWLEPIIEQRAGNRFEIVGFSKNKMHEKECLIIDEFSMVDDELWSEVMRVWDNSGALENKKIILVGDEGQLEPVGEGHPFVDILNDDRYPIVRLQKIHRNDENSGIVLMASFVRKHGYLDINKKYPNVFFISKDDALKTISENTSVQLITPKRNGPLGSLIINNEIKKIMNINESPDFQTLIWDDEKKRYQSASDVHLNDKVIIVRNTWEWNITNGTTGIYQGMTKRKIYNHVTKKYSQMRKVFIFENPDTNKTFYLPANNNTKSRLELAYAITIHKAQGSEYKSVILYLPENWVDKKMLYTAVTRAKKNLLICRQ